MVSAVACVAVVSPVRAQTSAAANKPAAVGIEELVVTARRTEEKLQSVPIAISAFSGEELGKHNIKDPRDLMAGVPGLAALPGNNRGTDNTVYAVRGQMNADASIAADPSVGLYFADAPWARTAGSNSAFVDLQGVQVLKGPQGTLFGRNSDAGAILITPKSPTDQLEGYAKFTVGNLGLKGAEGVLNIPAGDNLAFRLAGLTTHRDGYMHFVNTGVDASDINSSVVRLSAKFSPSDAFTSTLIGNYSYTHDHGNGDKLIQLASSPAPGLSTLLRPALVSALAQEQALGKYQSLSSNGPGVFFLPALIPPGVPLLPTPVPFLKFYSETYTAVDTSTLKLGTNDLLGDALLKSIVSYRHVRSQWVGGAMNATPFYAVAPLGFNSVGQVSAELQLQGEREDLKYVVGVFYFREKGIEGTPCGYSFSVICTYIDGTAINTSYSGFGHLVFDLSAMLPGLSISGGGRWNVDKREWQDRNRVQIAYQSPTYRCSYSTTVFSPADGSGCHFAPTVTFKEPTWDVGANYNFTPRNMLYASVAHGYRSGGFANTSQAPAGNTPYLPEFVTNYEIGMKNDFDFDGVAVRLNIAAYHMDYHDLQRTLLQIFNGTGQTATVNAAQAKIEGAEVDLTVKPAPQWEAYLGYAYTAPKYKSFTDYILDKGVAYPIDASASGFRDISKHAVTATLRWTPEISGEFGQPTFLLSYSYHSSFWPSSTDINTVPCSAPSDPNVPPAFYASCLNHEYKVPAQGLANFRADWSNMMGWGVDGALFVNNLANKYYMINAFSFLSNAGAVTGFPGPPRTFGVELKVAFGAR